jgi:hypothetical protein
MPPEAQRLLNENSRAYRKPDWIVDVFYFFLAVLSICLVILGWIIGLYDF